MRIAESQIQVIYHMNSRQATTHSKQAYSSTRWRLSDRLHVLVALSQGEEPLSTHLILALVGTRASLDGVEKRNSLAFLQNRILILRSSVP